MRSVRTAVILLNFRGAGDTLACLDSLLAADVGFQRLYIADNGSPDGSLEQLRNGLRQRQSSIAAARDRWSLDLPTGLPDWGEGHAASEEIPSLWITLLDNGANLGFAAGNNTALQLARKEPDVTHFWLLNNDTEVQHDTLAELERASVARADVDLWGATVVYHDDPGVVQALGGGAMNPSTGYTHHIGAFQELRQVQSSTQVASDAERQMDYALGASMFASRRWLERVGLLSPSFFLYYEELDWATRGRRLGLKLGYAPAAVVRHKEGASIGTAPSGGSVLSVYHLARSRLIFMRRHRKAALPRVIASVFWQAFKYLLKGMPSKSTATLQGAWNGIRSDASIVGS